MANLVHVLMLYSALQNPIGLAVDTSTYESLVKQGRAAYWSGRFGESAAALIAAMHALPAGDQARRAVTLSDLGEIYANQDELLKAEQAYGESLDIFRRLGDEASAISVLRSLASVYSLQRREDDAQRAIEKAVKMAKARDEQDPVLQSLLLNTLGVIHYRRGKMNKAEKAFQQAAQMLPVGARLSDRADLMNNLGAIYLARRAFDKAEKHFIQAMKLTESLVGSAHPDVTYSLAMLGILYTGMKRYAAAEERFKRAIALLEPLGSVVETRIARFRLGLSANYAAAGRQADADRELLEAVEIAGRNIAKHSDMALIMNVYATKLKKDGRKSEAEEIDSQVARARAAAALVVNAYRPF